MSDLRTAAQQALEALEAVDNDEHGKTSFPATVYTAIIKLRAALAQPAASGGQADLIAAAQQALEALGLWATGRDMDAVALNDLILRLEAALENQFNPDWDRTEALQESLREHMAEIHRLRAALAEPEGGGNLPPTLPVEFDHGIGADRFKVVRGAFWWHVLIGDSPTEHGKFRSRASAEKMAADLLREFRNGAFVQHEAALAEPVQKQAEPDHETRAEIAEQQVVQLAEERDHYRNLWQKAQQAEPVQEPVAQVLDGAWNTTYIAWLAKWKPPAGMPLYATAQPAPARAPSSVNPEAHADFVRALHGEKGDLDAWLECYDETEVRAHVLALVQQPAASEEPVAWIYQNSNTDREYLVWQKGTGGRNWRPLYTAQPAPAPECDSPKLCAVNGACAGQYGTKKQCATAQPAPARVPRTLTEEQLERHGISASECPPNSQVMLVSSIRRLLGYAGTPAKEAP